MFDYFRLLFPQAWCLFLCISALQGPGVHRADQGKAGSVKQCHPKFLQQRPALATAFLPSGVLGQVSKQLAETYWAKRRSERFLFQIGAFWQMAKMNNRQLAFWMGGGGPIYLWDCLLFGGCWFWLLWHSLVVSSCWHLSSPGAFSGILLCF